MRGVRWEKHMPGLARSNVRTSFSGCELQQEGPICARLGLDRDTPSIFKYSDERVSIAAYVRMGRARITCQDSAMVFVGNGRAAIGVFDGFKAAGSMLSEFVPDRTIEYLAADARNFPFQRAVVDACSMSEPPEFQRKGGATAAFASVSLDDLGYHLMGVSDAAAYRLWGHANEAHGLVERRLEYGNDSRGHPIAGKELEAYFERRNVVSRTITCGCLDELKINTDGGMLMPGEGILLATDGITKNLSVLFDPSSYKVTENSGCRDLGRILSRCSSPWGIIAAIIGEIDRRITFRSQEGYAPDMPTGEAIRPDADDMAIAVIIV